MFYKKQGYPEEGEIAVATVKKILYHSVFATLDEYASMEGMIHISEISPGRIRNIRDYVKEGKQIICKILRIDRQKGHIDLSLRRVSTTQRINKTADWKQEQKAEKALGVLGKKLDKSLDKQGYKPTLETRAGTEVSAFDNANRLRSGLKKGGSAKKKKGGAAIRGISKILR